MIATFFAIIYITIICWGYGTLLLRGLASFTRGAVYTSSSIIITCFCGLAFIAVLFNILTLFLPVGTITAQLILLIPALYSLISNKPLVNSELKCIRQKLSHFPTSVWALLTGGVLLVLVMNAGLINHPDTLNYHAQHIEWVKNHKAVPGLVHLNVNLGTQSSWFVLCALFSFSFTGTTALTFINAAVLCWFLIFVAQKINECVKEDRTMTGLLWMLLLTFSFWSYTQMRLTATSGSPDFIAALSCWLIIFLFVNKTIPRNNVFYGLLLFLSFFAVTLKLSALPCILLSGYAWYRHRTAGAVTYVLFPLLTGALILIPYLANNVINTGYLLFPSPTPDVFDVDWKLEEDKLVVFQDYVTSYARTHVEYDPVQIASVMNMSMTEWLPVWWKIRSLADQLILASIPMMLLTGIFFSRRILRTKERLVLTATIFSAIGLLFWFINAPDPRFGVGFLIPFSGLLLVLLTEKLQIKKHFLLFALLIFSGGVFAYTGYRLIYFFKPKNILHSSGISAINYQTKNCNGLLINFPIGQMECGTTSLPCSNNKCEDIVPRGNSIEQGFRPITR